MYAQSDVVCFGDSITFGQYLPSKLDAFPYLLNASLSLKVIGRGVPNNTTRDALLRFPEHVQQSGASVAFIQFGHNDCNRWDSDGGLPRVSLAAFRANCAEMVDRCRRFAIRPVFIAPHPTLLGDRYERDRRIYANALLDMEDVEVVVPIVVPDGLLLDDLHLNEAGHRRYASVLREYL